MVIDQKAHEARLRRLIARGLKMERLKKSLKDRLEILESNIEDLMKDLELRRFVGSTGEALIIPSQKREWNEEKLQEVLTTKQWKQYCPPKPDGAALSAYLKSLVHDPANAAKLDDCSKVETTPFVRLAAPKEVKDRVEKPATESRITPEFKAALDRGATQFWNPRVGQLF